MARYIDADKYVEYLEKEICSKCIDEVCGACGLDSARWIAEEFPTADVAPRAEVAREIFEEINAIKKEYASGDIDGNELYIRLYQLEKKYTEARND